MRIKRVYVYVCICLPWMSESAMYLYVVRVFVTQTRSIVVNQMLDKHRA